MDGQSDAIRFLKSLTSFSGLQSATVKTIASRCRLRSRQAGEDLFLEGDPCRDLYQRSEGTRRLLACPRAWELNGPDSFRALIRPAVSRRRCTRGSWRPTPMANGRPRVTSASPTPLTRAGRRGS